MKKTTKTLIIAVASVAVLSGAFALVYKFVPQQEDPKDIANINSISSTEPTGTADYVAQEDVPAEYALIQHIPAEIRKIEVTNETGSYTLLSDTPTAEVTNEDGTTSTVTETTIYTLVGFEDKELLTGYPDMLANDSAALVAGKKVNDGSKKEDFGFDSPRATVTVTYSSGESATVIVGDDAPDNQGAYVMVQGDENVYLAASDSVDGFLLGAMGMITTEIGSAASDDSGNIFSKMVMGGTLFGGDVVFDYANSENFSETYRITSPDNVLANEEVVTYMLNNVRNLKADEVIAVNVPDSKLADYGLDAPYATVSAEYPDLKVDYKASKPDGEGNFYLLSNGVVYKMSTDSVPWVLHDYNECVVQSILRPKYGTVTGISIEADGKKYDFDIKTTEEKDGDVTNTTTTVTCGSAVIDEDKFNTFTQNLESAERAGGIEKSDDLGKSILKITLKFGNGETTQAEFYEAQNRKCPVVINGTLGSFAYETYVTKMIADTATIAANGSVESVY
ncbi:MAG: DUF4340 domain-containing protein [Clostridia bacterium]|nr:DUF4340 domain-containing protein [Clostridia bacterium]